MLVMEVDLEDVIDEEEFFIGEKFCWCVFIVGMNKFVVQLYWVKVFFIFSNELLIDLFEDKGFDILVFDCEICCKYMS